MTSIETMLAIEGIHTTRQTVKNTIERWQKTGDVRDCPRSGPPVKVPQEHYRCIDEALAINDELIKRFGADKVQYGVRTITRVRNELDWSFTTARYCQAIREANKTKT